MRRKIPRINQQETSQERQDGGQESENPREPAGEAAPLATSGAETQNALPSNSKAITRTPSGKSKTSYRRPNRDYSKSIEWSYELHKDVYDIYLKAKADPKPGYMKRMKTLWNNKHPTIEISEKSLRERAVRVIQKKLIRETGLVIEEQENETVQRQNETENIQHSPADNSNQNNNTSSNNTNKEQSSQPDSDKHLREGENYTKLKGKYFNNFKKFKSCTLEERPYKTKIDRKINAENQEIINIIIADQLDEMNQGSGISLWVINVIHYTAATTVFEQEGKLKENKYFEKQNTKPEWKIQLEQKIEAIRKRIAYIDAILKCKNKQETYTKHQRKIKERLKKWYRRTSQENLESICGELKHELTRTYTSKLKKRRTVEQRDRINKEFSLNPKNVYCKFKTDENIEIKDTPSRDNVTSYTNT